MNEYRILIVDDEQNVCDFLGEFLQDKGYIVLKAKSGDEALRCLGKNGVDLVLLDILMPGMSGLEVLKHIRKLYPDLPVIILTGVKDKKVVDDIINVGPVDFIPKPIDLDVLEKCITRNLSPK
ncbi:MAG TPA: response regulator [Candidatus Marinimicrobia bacterium]|nr:response regulator [Candidatus Neomarinimicrobiota bacterium]HRS51289.1 response regulator [Candidatus Neomarinimicrobiota bacterium]HRU91473.1 response regulator [Candidatus Neomarinimicrobiota bacterium]